MISADVFRAAHDALRRGERPVALLALVKALKGDVRDPQGWLWLAAVVDTQTERDYCLTRALDFQARGPALPTGLQPAAREDDRLIETALAGVMFNQHDQAIRRMALGEQVWLRREPDNEFDANAIQVQRDTGEGIGYLDRRLAAQLAPRMDAEGRRRPAIVTQLAGDAALMALKVHIAFYLPAGWSALPSQLLEYWYEESATAGYLLLNCGESLLAEIKGRLYTHGLAYARSGLCYRPASNGRSYQWYVRFEKDSGVTEELVVAFFYDQFQLESERARVEALEQDRQQKQSEVDTLRRQLAEEAQFSGLAVEETSNLETRLFHAEAEIKRVTDEKRQLEYKQRTQELAWTYPDSADRSDDIPDRVAAVLRNTVSESLTLSQILTVIAGLFPDRVEILDSARKSAEEAKAFRDRRRAFLLMWKLATEYWTLLSSGRGDVEASQVFGDDFAPNDSRAHVFQHKGQPIQMGRHLRLGTKPGTAETLRIHFAWDAEERKLVIGHCGKHR